MKYLVSLNGKQYEVIVEHHTANVTNVTSFVSEQSQKGPSIDNKQTDDFPLSGTLPANSTAVKAPLPGTITKLNVKNGQNIKHGEIICILEAMKMENEIRSVTDGVVKEVFVEAGMKVGLNDRIMVIE